MNTEEFDFTNPQELRQKAEERLSKKQSINGNHSEEAYIKKLLHELQVHQIELEMQNEELQMAYETAELALKKYTLLYDMAPMGYFILDSAGRILELNFTGADMLGEKRFELKDQNFRQFITADTLAEFDRFYDKIYQRIVKDSCHVALIRADESYEKTSVFIEGVVIEDDKKCLLSIVDISTFPK